MGVGHCLGKVEVVNSIVSSVVRKVLFVLIREPRGRHKGPTMFLSVFVSTTSCLFCSCSMSEVRVGVMLDNLVLVSERMVMVSCRYSFVYEIVLRV